MWDNKQHKVTKGSPEIALEGNIAVSNNNIRAIQKSPGPRTKASWLAAVFEPLLFPFAVVALRFLTASARKATAPS